jgi:hypothetical protein
VRNLRPIHTSCCGMLANLKLSLLMFTNTQIHPLRSWHRRGGLSLSRYFVKIINWISKYRPIFRHTFSTVLIVIYIFFKTWHENGSNKTWLILGLLQNSDVLIGPHEEIKCLSLLYILIRTLNKWRFFPKQRLCKVRNKYVFWPPHSSSG